MFINVTSALSKCDNKMNKSDMTIHVTQQLLPVQQKKLEDEISELKGVSAARFNYEMNNLLNVLYDPVSINPRKILKQVRQWDEDSVVL